MVEEVVASWFMCTTGNSFHLLVVSISDVAFIGVVVAAAAASGTGNGASSFPDEDLLFWPKPGHGIMKGFCCCRCRAQMEETKVAALPPNACLLLFSHSTILWHVFAP